MSKKPHTPALGAHSARKTSPHLGHLLTVKKPARRRLEELKRLPFRVSAISPWHHRIGSLHIWIHAGRWWNEATNVHGSLRTASIEALAISEWNRQLECLILKLSGSQNYSAASDDTIS